MSHNKVKVAGKSPNQEGDISVSLNDLNDVSITSVSTNQGLKYNGGTWANDSITSTSFDLASYSQTTGAAYSTNAANYEDYTYLEYDGFYLSTRWNDQALFLMDITDSTYSSIHKTAISQGAQYISAVLVKANNPTLLQLDLVLAEFSDTTAIVDLQWQDQSGNKYGPIMRLNMQNGYNRTTLVGFANPSTDTLIGIKRVFSSGYYRFNFSTADRQEYKLLARKVG